ncbi:ACP S-malonyltransferase [Ruminiclostridium josui]|uniref:ACP S-malonyltransferase n=1 Tax=Ruminiclostridium josui TaxID=1499 RepID=UPI0004653ACB|nr:ACP S-malonyltransferase [Ruminiclostridium josui]
MVVYSFPGQGSQAKGMGGILFDEFKDYTSQADEILGYSIKKLCLEDPDSNLGQTQYTQPALFVVNALSYLKKIQEVGRKPDFVLGHSLGEYNALFAADVFDFETGLRLVQKRGNLMAMAVGGGMAAVIGLSEEQVFDVLKQNNLHTIDIANLNSPYQIVISGLKADIDLAEAIFKSHPDVKMYIPLKTSGAFHSRYMEKAKVEFENFISDISLNEPKIPVISNVTARPYIKTEIKRNMVNQITHPVKWTESIRYLLGFGELEFNEIGAGKVLTGLFSRIQKEANPIEIPNDEKESVLSGRYGITYAAVESQGTLKYTDINNSITESKNFPSVEPEGITPFSLGDSEFKKDYNLKYAYLAGGMYRGISSKEMVVKMGKAGMMGFLGTGGLKIPEIQESISYIKSELSRNEAYGINFLHHPENHEMEEKIIDIILDNGINIIEAAAFLGITPALVKYRGKGLKRIANGKVIATNRIIAKVSRPEVAEAFLSPAPNRIVKKLLEERKLSQEEADMLAETAMADDICVEADSGGHTDSGVAYTLMPAITTLRDRMQEKFGFHKKIRVGAAGGIGTPESAAAAFILDADFILTGSINQCTVEAATSSAVKDLLQKANVQDTEYAPAGDMFEIGAKVQVLKKGLFFPARANKLYDLYRQHNSLEEIDLKTRTQLQEKYFMKSFEDIYSEIVNKYPHEISKAEKSPKYKMALIFKWYFRYSTKLALEGNEDQRVNYQVHCGPALGAFNQWVKGTELENWRNRHVDEIGIKIMNETAAYLNSQFHSLMKHCV